MIEIESILFRRVGSANAGALLGHNKGQYHLTLSNLPEVHEFFSDLQQTAGNNGAWTAGLPLQAVGGTSAVAPVSLNLSCLGPNNKRANDLNVTAQKTNPYELWDPERARPELFQHAGGSYASMADVPTSELERDVVIIAKDVAGGLHARWVLEAEIPELPPQVQERLTNGDTAGAVELVGGATGRVAEIARALRAHHNVLLYGPPGTGKTHLVSEVRRAFGAAWLLDEAAARLPFHLAESAGRQAWTTFHQSYSYEEFLVGLRPVTASRGGFELVPRAGVLLELAEWARQPGHESLLIIDEINRGNVSRIFGEFITLIEPDKRLDTGLNPTRQTVEVRLPFIERTGQLEVDLGGGTSADVPVPFTMPNPVYTLATMNSVDKSVAPLDAALRRRFHVIDLFPDVDELAEELGVARIDADKSTVPTSPATVEQVRVTAREFLRIVNARLRVFLGVDFEFGQWLFAPVLGHLSDAQAVAALATCWRASFGPQLEDYFVGRSDQLDAVLGRPTTNLKGTRALLVDRPEDGFTELGAALSIRTNPHASDREIVDFIAWIVRAELPEAPSSGASATVVDSGEGEASATSDDGARPAALTELSGDSSAQVPEGRGENSATPELN